MKRLAIYAHYDAENGVKPYVLHCLRHFREVCDEILFVSTSRLAEDERTKLGACCSRILLKENVGLDFGMWQCGLEQAALGGWDELLLANSSVYGPLTSLEGLFREMGQEPWDIWGLTDSCEQDYHLQSYFLVFRKVAMQSDSFRAFWDSVLPFRNKNQVIRSYEVGLTQYFLDAGFSMGARYPIESFKPRSRWTRMTRRKLWTRPNNPTLAFPVDLLERGMPFVKVDLLRDNPRKADLKAVLEHMKRSGYPMECLLRTGVCARFLA